MVRQQRASTVHEDRYHRRKDELVKRDMLDPPSYLRRRRTQDIRGKALSFWCFGLETEKTEPAFKMVTRDNELHSAEFGSTVFILEAFFISLAVRNYQNWCEEEEEVVLKRQTSNKYASNPPVSPIGRV
ncbi:unnamed protein product [Brassica rapa]|uniref:Uncharacterized protein n=1 Tax=Brassica campestris TaxID=3711 RepID=A0A3P5YSF8_BRACM|nr:unnamed protein product [Brassica rapa]VDC70059.1 unnamed protein product [Brassica rapa]